MRIPMSQKAGAPKVAHQTHLKKQAMRVNIGEIPPRTKVTVAAKKVPGREGRVLIVKIRETMVIWIQSKKVVLLETVMTKKSKW